MRGYTPGEQPKGGPVVKLNTNENPYPPSKPVLRAVLQAVNGRLRLYPEPAADTLRKRLSQIHRWPLEGILVGNGSDEILSLLFHASVGKGDLVQFPDLTYSLYPILAQLREAKVREVPLDGNFHWPFEKLSLGARLTLWGHPNPPVGNCFDLQAMKSFCSKAKGLALIDEAYVDFAREDCLSLARAYPNVLILRTFSKSFSLAGARLGYVLGHPEAVGQLMKVKDSYNVNRLTQALGQAALSPGGLREMGKNVRKIRGERDRLAQALRDMGFSVPESQANFILATREGKPGAESLYKNLKKKRVLVRYFPHPRLRNSLRITVGAPEENRKFLAALKDAMGK